MNLDRYLPLPYYSRCLSMLLFREISVVRYFSPLKASNYRLTVIMISDNCIIIKTHAYKKSTKRACYCVSLRFSSPSIFYIFSLQ